MRLAACCALLLAAGCQDYGLLKKSFCATATKNASTQPVALCDGFDAQSVDGYLWQVDSSPDAEVKSELESSGGDLTHANRGPGALVLKAGQFGHAQIWESAKTTAMMTAGPGSAGDDTYFAIRFFVNSGGGTIPGVTQVVSVEDATGKQRAAFEIVDGYFAVSDPDTGRLIRTAGQPRSREWDCIELRFGNTLTLWGGDISPIFVVPGFSKGSGFATTRIGLTRAKDDAYTSQHQLWIDDVIIDNQVIGCEK